MPRTRRKPTTKLKTYTGAAVNYANNGVANAALAELVRMLAKLGVNITTVADSRMVEYGTQVIVLVDEVPEEIINTIGEHVDNGAFCLVLNHRAINGTGWAKLWSLYQDRPDIALMDIAEPNTTQNITFIGGVVEAMWDIEVAEKLSAWLAQRSS